MLNLFNKKKKNTTIYSVTDQHDELGSSTLEERKIAFDSDHRLNSDTVSNARASVKKIQEEVERQIDEEVKQGLGNKKIGDPQEDDLVQDIKNLENDNEVKLNIDTPVTSISDKEDVNAIINNSKPDEEPIEDIKADLSNKIPDNAERNPLNPESIISVKNLTLRLGDEDEIILNNLNINIDRGEFVFLIGPSGAGKTTLMNALNAQFKRYDGEIIIDGDDLKNIRKRNIYKIRRKLGYIFQDFKLLESKNAFENIALGIEVLGVKDGDLNLKVLDLLDLVGLGDREDDTIFELSGGEKQRLSIARALASNPPIILADEPTGNLDDATGWKIVEILLKLNEAGSTIIFGTHNKDIVNTLKKRVIHIENGSLVSDKNNASYE